MSVQFGFVVAAGPDREAPERYLDDLDRHKVAIERQFSSLWMTDHFFWEDAPTYEAWTVMAYLAARLLLPGLAADIPAGRVAAGVLAGALSLAVGLLNAACMTY